MVPLARRARAAAITDRMRPGTPSSHRRRVVVIRWRSGGARVRGEARENERGGRSAASLVRSPLREELEPEARDRL
jgi:hypothetical protein